MNKENLYFKWTGKEWFFVILYTLISFQFYNYTPLGSTMQKLPSFVIVPIMFIFCWKTFLLHSHNTFFKLVRCIIVITIVSIISAYVFKGQSLVLGFRASASFFVLLFYFYLYKRKPSLKSVELYIYILGLMYCLFWLYALTQFPTPVFGGGSDGEMTEDLSRGFLRINFTGRLSLIFAYFLSINKAYDTRKKVYMFLAIMFFVFLVLQVTRQLILLTALVSIIYLFKKSKRLLFLSVICLLFIYILGASIKFDNNSIIGSMISLSEQQANDFKSGEEDVRITEYKYFFSEWPSNIVTNIIGNGFPHADCNYGMYYENLKERQMLFLSDVGYAKIYVVTGLIGLFLYLSLFLKIQSVRMPNHLMYAKMYMLFLILANFTADWYIKVDGQIAMSIAVYLMTIYSHHTRKPKKSIIYKSSIL